MYLDKIDTGYGYDFAWAHLPEKGNFEALWRPQVTTPGDYEVFTCWEGGSNLATDAAYTINYNGGSETVYRNQRQNGAQWNSLGTYPFTAGTDGYVVLSNDANGFVTADAVMLMPDF